MSRKKNTSRKKKRDSNKELLEFVDEFKRPLGVLSRESIHRHQLRHKSVQILLFNKEKRLFLQQRSYNKEIYPGFWDLSAAGHVLFGESSWDAAFRELKEELGIEVNSLRLIYEFPASYYSGYEFLSLFGSRPSSEVPSWNPEEVIQGLFVNKQEMSYLINFYSEFLTPGLKFYWSKGFLFPDW